MTLKCPKRWQVILGVYLWVGIILGGVLPSAQAQTQPTAAVGPLNLPAINQIKSTTSGAGIEQLLRSLPKEADLTDPYLILVNKQNPLKQEMGINFAYTYEGYPIRYEIYQAYVNFVNAASQAGYPLGLISGYRSMAEQSANREARINSYLNEGLSYEEALYWTDAYYAPVDASEHSTGLAIDALGYDWLSIGGELSGTYAYQGSAIWMAENAHLYGFILRYPEDKTDITGYNFEPWHFRYVGAANAEFMHRHGLTLEEYLALLVEAQKIKPPDASKP